MGYGRAIRRGAEIANGEESVGGYVLKLIGADTQRVLHRVNAKLDEINDSLPVCIFMHAPPCATLVSHIE